LWRRRFAQTLTYLVRAHPQLCVAVLGIDCFQDVNLATDFESGDTMLRWMAGLLQRNLPEQAVLGRWCSDQFVVALPGVDLDGASQILEHTLANVRQEVFGDVAGRLLRLTFSAGVAQYQRDGVTVEELYAAAARGMALAKRNGRGAIVQSAWFETPGFLEEPAEVFLVHSDAELCRRLRRALQARARHVELVPPSRQLLSTLGMKLGQRSGVVVVLEVKSQDPDAWAVLRTFSRTRAAEATRLLVLLDQTTQSVKDEAFSLGAWFVLGADAQFPQLVQRIREALG
jgi:diguanylate cyclase (GGDEF)-like protein